MTYKLIFSIHAIKQMIERNISKQQVRDTFDHGEVIEDYPYDSPYPSRLMLKFFAVRPIHIVIAENTAANEIIVITAYEPKPELWEPGFKKRKKS